jgi:hypothetical protein
MKILQKPWLKKYSENLIISGSIIELTTFVPSNEFRKAKDL